MDQTVHSLDAKLGKPGTLTPFGAPRLALLTISPQTSPKLFYGSSWIIAFPGLNLCIPVPGESLDRNGTYTPPSLIMIA